MYQERGRWPTVNGIAVSIYEIPNQPRPETLETNNHHDEFQARDFCVNCLLLTVRNLKSEQQDTPIDLHNWFHYNFAPPILPTPIQAMNKIEEEYYTGGILKIKHKGKGYIERPLTENDFKQCKEFYDSLKK